jgi:IS4 transposase
VSACAPQSKVADPLRRIAYYDVENKRRLVFLTNNFTLPALTITRLYKSRWQVELFFKWIKQYLRIKAFSGTSANAVKTQVWVAISVYVLVAILKRELKLEQSLYEILQILSLTLFEKSPVFQVLRVWLPHVWLLRKIRCIKGASASTNPTKHGKNNQLDLLMGEIDR